MKHKPNFVLREIADDYIIVPLGEEADHIQGILKLSSSGAFLWKLLDTEQSEQYLVSALLDKYEVDEATATEAVKDFVKSLEEIGCLE